MTFGSYKTAGGKDLIIDYIESLPIKEKAEGYYIIEQLEKEGSAALEYLNTRQIRQIRQFRGKLWEIKFFRQNRIFYVLPDQDNIYLLHACKKQKDRAERHEVEKALARAKEIY